jgi:hypothetical protein
MENDIFFLVNILNDNNYIEKVDEEFDKQVSDLLDTESLDEEISVKHIGNPFYVELNGYSDPSDLNNYLLDSFSNFKRTAADSRLDKNKVLQNEITQRIFSARTDLEQIKSVSRKNKFKNHIELIDLKIDFCDRILGFLSNIKNEVFKLLRKESGTYTDLTQKEIVILFHHMRKLGYVGKGLENDDFAEPIAEITDLSSNRIRQDLSIIQDLYSKDFLSTDYIRIQAALKKLRDSMDENRKEKELIEIARTKNIPPK